MRHYKFFVFRGLFSSLFALLLVSCGQADKKKTYELNEVGKNAADYETETNNNPYAGAIDWNKKSQEIGEVLGGPSGMSDEELLKQLRSAYANNGQEVFDMLQQLAKETGDNPARLNSEMTGIVNFIAFLQGKIDAAVAEKVSKALVKVSEEIKKMKNQQNKGGFFKFLSGVFSEIIKTALPMVMSKLPI